MNERVKDEQSPSRIAPKVEFPSESGRPDSFGIGVRIDPAHILSVETEARQVEWQDLDHFVPAATSQKAPVLKEHVSSNQEIETVPMDDWGQVARKLHSQIQSLEQREQDLRFRLSRFDEEERSFRQSVANDQSELQRRKNLLQRNESELAERFIEFEMRFRKFEAEREIVNHQRAELERRKLALRDEVHADLQAEKAENERIKTSLKLELEQTRLLKDSLQTHLKELASENEKTLLNEREKLWQSLSEEWEQRNLAFQQERDLWSQQRELERSDFEREKMMFESSVETANAEFFKTREQHQTQIDAEKQEWSQVRRRQEAELAVQAEEQRLEFLRSREALALEIERSRTALALEIDSERNRHADLLKAERTEHAESLKAERTEWEQVRLKEKTAIEAEQDRLLADREAQMLELKAQRERHVDELSMERKAWEEFRDRETSQMEAQHNEWLASRDSSLAASRDALEVEFIGLREQHSLRLKVEREEWEQTLLRETARLEERQGELLRERTLIENRIRFQQVHLEKSRAEFEQAQNQFRRERQDELQRLEELGKQMIQRVRQIDLYRSSIDEREKSLDRELEVFNRTRKAISSTVDHDRMNLQAERHAWEQDRQTQQNEVRRQQELLATKAESLESRRIRLDKLRSELEETHRATLEMRLALEEAWAQLTQVAGQEESRQRVDQVRQSLSGFYQQMHESLAVQRNEHLEAQSKFERQRTEFTEERQKLTTWLTSRDEELRLGEERLRISAMESAEHHSKWRAARDRWLIEKTEAEQLIRRLLASLGENNRELSGEMNSIRRLGEINATFDE